MLPLLKLIYQNYKKRQAKVEFLKGVQSQLLAGRKPSEFGSLDGNELNDKLDNLDLLTAKPVIYLFNVEENDLTNLDRQTELRQMASRATGESVDDIQAIFVCAELESEIRDLSEIEANELLADYGITEPGLDQLIKAAYHTLGLQSFLTAGEKEVRAWTIHQGWTAPQAAGVIHSDFERGFIAAQVVSYNDLIQYRSESAARAAGKVRTEGKTYIMQPDDIVEFKFNV